MQKKYNAALIIFIIFLQDILGNELFKRIIENDYTVLTLIFTEGSLFLLIYFMYYGDLLKKIIIYTIVYLTNKFLSSIIIMIVCLIPDSFSDSVFIYISIIMDFGKAAVFFMILYFIAEKLKCYTDKFFKKFHIPILIPAIIIMFMINIVDILFLKMQKPSILQKYNNANTYLLIFSVFELIITMVLIYFIQHNLNAEKMNMHYKAQNDYYRELIAHEEKMRIIKHDIKNHLICIQGFLSYNKIKDAENYIAEIINYMADTDYIIRTGNNIADIILNAKSKQIEENNIKFDCTIIMPILHNINDFDLCIILGNAIDNAIEGCNRIKDQNILKNISVKSAVDKGYLLIEIKNTYDNKIKRINGKFYTEKANKLNHGYGLKNISDTLKKYNGMYEIYTEDKFFKLLIMIPYYSKS